MAPAFASSLEVSAAKQLAAHDEPTAIATTTWSQEELALLQEQRPPTLTATGQNYEHWSVKPGRRPLAPTCVVVPPGDPSSNPFTLYANPHV